MDQKNFIWKLFSGPSPKNFYDYFLSFSPSLFTHWAVYTIFFSRLSIEDDDDDGGS